MVFGALVVCYSSKTRAEPSVIAVATFFRAEHNIRWIVPRDTFILRPACSWVRPSLSQSLKVSISSLNIIIWTRSFMGVPVGLNAWAQTVPAQNRFFLGLGIFFN